MTFANELTAVYWVKLKIVGYTECSTTAASHYLDANFHHCHCGAATKVIEA